MSIDISKKFYLRLYDGLPVRGHRETRRPGEGGSLSGSKVAVGTSWPRDWMLALEVGQEPKEGGGPLWGQSS